MSHRDLHPGDTLPELRPGRITRSMLALFAGASGDHQPTHLDIDAARAKGRDDVIAHGMLMMAMMGRMLTDLAPQERIRTYKARFVAVTPVNAEPVFSGKVVAVENGTVRLELEGRLADGSLVVRGEAAVDIG